MTYYIYKITNNINGMSYIGQHIKKKEYPRQYMGKGLAITEAYRKYGRSNFTKEILEEIEDDENRKLVSEREKHWIAKLNTMEPNGYNRNPGGIGGCTKESAKKVHETRRRNGYLHHSEETRKKMSDAKKGKSFTEEHKRHLSENHHNKTIHILMFEDGHFEETTDSIMSIASKFNTSQNSLLRYSARKEFINGVMLKDIDPQKYACCRKIPPKSKFIMCNDPILKNECSLKNLRQRKRRHPDLYKNIIPENHCITEGDTI